MNSVVDECVFVLQVDCGCCGAGRGGGGGDGGGATARRPRAASIMRRGGAAAPLLLLAAAVAAAASAVASANRTASGGGSPAGPTWPAPGRWLPAHEAQTLLRREAAATGRSHVDCCPSVVEMVEPEGGKNMDGMYVELYRDGHNRQRFYEVSCRPDVENRPCRFVERRLHAQSVCVQTFSYSYALVKDQRGTGGGVREPGARAGPERSWTMDYIEVRSGCSCVVRPRPRRRQHGTGAAAHSRQRHRAAGRRAGAGGGTTPTPPPPPD